MATTDISESGFQTPASKKKKASVSLSLPPASQPTAQLSSWTNRTPLIATIIDSKFNMQIRIMSKLRQCHPSLIVYEIKQTQKGWIFIRDTPKDFLLSEPSFGF